MAFKMWQRGNDVIAEQQRLNKAGAKLVVDGIYGPQTQAAQKKYGVNQTKTTTTTKTKTPTYGTMPTTLPNTGTFTFKDTKPTYTAPTNPYANFTAPEYTAMTYDTAKTQAGDRINPEYAMKLQDALNNVKNQSMGSGFFGQLPQLQVSADESARNENQRAIAIADMARQLQADDESKYDKLYDRAFNMWRSNRSDFDADRQFGYGQYRDNVGDWDSNRDFAWGQYQDKKDTAYKDYGIKNDNYQWKTTYDRGVLESDRDFKLAQEKVGSSGGGGGGGGGRRKSSGGSSSKTNSGKSKSTKTKATTTKTVKQYPSVKEMTKARDDSLKKVLGWKW